MPQKISQMTKHPLAQYTLLIFDLDGTLRHCKAHGGPCHNGPGEWALYPDVPGILAQYVWQFLALGVATNQAAIGLGLLAESVVWEEMHTTVREALAMVRKGLPRQAVFELCPHTPDEGCGCRKPASGMLVRSMQRAEVTQEATLFVGDSLEDAQAAASAGCAFVPAWEFFGRAKPVWAPWTQAERDAAYREIATTGGRLG